MDSVRTFLKEVGVEEGDIVSEAEALTHMIGAIPEGSRGSDIANPFGPGGSVKFVKNITIPQYEGADAGITYVHADKTQDVAEGGG